MPNESESIYYRKIEKYVLENLYSNINWKYLDSLFRDGLVYKLLSGEVSQDILINREYLYMITHDVFYSSLFGRTTKIFDKYLPKLSEITTIFERSVLICIRKKDIDVLMELIVCIFILKLHSNVKYYIWQLILIFLDGYADKSGYIGDFTEGEGNVFSQVYHTSLVGYILGIILSQSTVNDQLSHDREEKIPSNVLLQILQNYSLTTSEKFLQDITFGDRKSIEKFFDLSRYFEIFQVIFLEECYIERLDSANHTVNLLKKMEAFDSNLEKRWIDICRQLDFHSYEQ